MNQREYPPTAPFREAVPPPPASLKNSGLHDKIDACLKCMQMGSKSHNGEAFISGASPQEAVEVMEEFDQLYKTDLAVKAYFDALYPIRLAQAETGREQAHAEKAGFATIEEHRAAKQRERFAEAAKELTSAVQKLQNMGVQSAGIEKIVREAIEAGKK